MTDKKFRGYDIEYRDGNWVFSDTGELVSDVWTDRPCGHCNKMNTKEGHDGCLGTLPFVMNACCGHGVVSAAFVQFWDGTITKGKKAIKIFENIRNAVKTK